jgi:hypothetical protein
MVSTTTAPTPYVQDSYPQLMVRQLRTFKAVQIAPLGDAFKSISLSCSTNSLTVDFFHTQEGRRVHGDDVRISASGSTKDGGIKWLRLSLVGALRLVEDLITLGHFWPNAWTAAQDCPL